MAKKRTRNSFDEFLAGLSVEQRKKLTDILDEYTTRDSMLSEDEKSKGVWRQIWDETMNKFNAEIERLKIEKLN